MTVIIFIIVLAVLIFVHELGHFLVARANGIRVDEFKLGFGPKLLAWKREETTYGVNLIPFGGFVKIHGENPDQESESGPDASRSFVNKNRWRQVSVLAAGVIFNFIFAWILYSLVFLNGVTATTDGFEQYADKFQNPRIMVTYLSPDSPASKAGVEVGDVVQSVVPINQNNITDTRPGTPIQQNVSAIQDNINGSEGKPIVLNVTRKNENKSITVTPQKGLVEGKYAIGIAMQNVGDLKLPFFSSIYEGAHYTFGMIKDTAVGLYTFVSNIFHGTANFSDVSGPVGIAGIVGSAAALGISYLLMITALISINLGVINLIPFPALDGGRILFVILEGIFRKRIPNRVANTVNFVGFALLMLLMIVVTYKDIAKLIK